MSGADPIGPQEGLLRFLREHLGDFRLTYLEPPEHIAGGSGVRVFRFQLASGPEGFNRPLVVRMIHDAQVGDTASFESCVQNTLAELGYPVPRVLACCDDPAALGVAFQVMPCVSGRALLTVGNNQGDPEGNASFLAQVIPDLHRLLLGDWPRQLARLHAKLHRIPAAHLLRALEADGFDPRRISIVAALDRVAATIEAYGFDDLCPALEWLRANLPAAAEQPAVCHGDFFANQVFGGHGVVNVLDWSDAIVGPAELDVGIVKCGIETAPVALWGPLDRIGLGTQRWLAGRFLSAYRELRPVDPAALRFGEVFRTVQTLVSVFTRRRAMDHEIGRAAGPHPGRRTRWRWQEYDSSAGVERLVAYLAPTASVRGKPTTAIVR